MGLKNIDKNKDIEKFAREEGSSNSLGRLITEEAYEQFGANFPKLIPFIAGINIEDKNPEGSILGGANLIIDGSKYIIPIIYNGNTTKTGFIIYNEDYDTMIGLTKKLVKRIVTSSGKLTGLSASKKVAFDKGDIKKLFTPPKTFAPKIASDGLFFRALENESIRVMMKKYANDNPEARGVLIEAFGDGIETILDETDLSKKASEEDDVSNPVVIDAITAPELNEWIFKTAAVREISRYGVSISVGKEYQKKSLIPIESPESILKSCLGTEALQTISSAGVYKVFNKNGNKIEYVIVANVGRPGLGEVREKSRLKIFSENGYSDLSMNIIGEPAKLSDVGYLRNINRDKAEGRSSMLIVKDNKPLHIIDRPASIRYGMGTISVKDNTNDSRIEIEIDSDRAAVVSLGVTYVGDSNVYSLASNNGVVGRFAILSDSENPSFAKDYYEASNIIKLKKDSLGNIIHEGKMYSEGKLASKLMGEGYDKLSVLTLIKTSSAEEESSFAEVSLKLDQITSVLHNLSGRVGSIEKSTSQQGSTKQETESANNGNVEVSQQQQQKDASVETSAAPSIGGFADNASGFSQNVKQEQDPLAEQAIEEQENQEKLIREQEFKKSMISEGINPEMDPSVLQSLMQLKDSPVMDVSALTAIAQSSDMNETMNNLLPEFQQGVSSMAKILFNIVARESELSEEIGDKQYKKVMTDLKTMLLKSTDMLLDMMDRAEQ